MPEIFSSQANILVVRVELDKYIAVLATFEFWLPMPVSSVVSEDCPLTQSLFSKVSGDRCRKKYDYENLEQNPDRQVR